MKARTHFIFVVAVLALISSAALACPMCKDSITETAVAAQQQGGSAAMNAGIPTGFNYSVYLLLIGVFCMMGMVIGIIAKGIRSTNTTSVLRK